MAQRQYHCYGCDQQFRMMVNLNDPASSDIKCTHCQCDFVEEAKTFNDDQARPQQPQMSAQASASAAQERQLPPQQPPMGFAQQSMSFGGVPLRQQ